MNGKFGDMETINELISKQASNNQFNYAIFFLYIFVALLVTDTIYCQKKAGKDDPLKALYYLWKVKDIKYLKISAMSDSTVRRLSHQSMLFSEKKATVFDDIYLKPAYELKIINTDSLLLREFDIKGTEIGLKEKNTYLVNITEIKGNMRSGQGCELRDEAFA